MTWKIRKGLGKFKGKEIDVWYVSPEPYKYGFATFTDEKAAYQYLEEVQKCDL